MKFFISTREIEQASNSLINHTDYRPGALTRPSKDGHEVFKLAEIIFRSNRHKLCKQPRMGERMTKLIGYISYTIKKVINSQLLIFEKNGLVWLADTWPAHFFQILKVRKIELFFLLRS